ncbi:hypothetical protein QF038_001601 [Pseudarthrobacter sp. W1I19]|uniref:hypothetical protein n=1 Tax=Pseudarthrobacter sp. W1I19 TaxID=3042288 RepID=UPI0027888E64|nr:hypothetical protein [Pseudarthrobacter sp. W1I19]MDQ0923093.1 hypothetical protein [Pseudarthrobacter sp. W1I19]
MTNTQRVDLAPSAKQPCKECPFRKSNADTEAPQGWYDKDNFERIWAGITRESRLLPCHMFDSEENTGYDSRSEQMGLQKPVILDRPRECAGITAMIHNEVKTAMEDPSWREYIVARPAGLQLAPFRYTIRRLRGEARPTLTVPANPDLDDVLDPAERVDVTSEAWRLGAGGADSLLATLTSVLQNFGIGPSCSCPVCENHGTVHEQAMLITADGHEVSVDKALHKALSIMAENGIRTTESCQDLRDAIERLAPHQIPTVLQDALQNPRAVSCAEAVKRRNAVVRFKVENDAERRFMELLRKHGWIFLEAGHLVGQITFPIERVGEVVLIAAAVGVAGR